MGHVGPATPSDETAAAILRVAEQLFAERGYPGVTVRDIAHEAGVTHPLIYYYWGSKRGLLAAVLARHQSRMREVAATAGTPREAIEALVRENLAGSRLYLLTLGRALMDGADPADWPGGFPGVGAALELLAAAGAGPEAAPGTPAPDAATRRLAAAAVAMLFGWLLIEDDLLAIVGLPAEDRPQARETLVDSFLRVLAPVLERTDG